MSLRRHRHYDVDVNMTSSKMPFLLYLHEVKNAKSFG